MKKILIIQNEIMHYRKAVYNELAKYYDVTILHSGNKSINNEDKYKEIIVSCKKIGPFVFQDKVLKTANSNQFDIVIAMFDIRWAMNIILSFFHNSKIKFIWWGIGFGKSKIGNYFRKILAIRSNALLLYTENAKKLFINQGVKKEKIFFANNTFHVSNRIESFKFKKDSIIFVGSLDLRKENDSLLKAFSLIIKDIPAEINLNIIGIGSELENLKKLSIDLEIDSRVNFVGKITDTGILEKYYKNAVCSVSFGQAGLSVLQSLAYGVPFVTKKNAISGGEITNIIDGYNGYLINDSIESLSIVLEELILNKEKAIEMGKNSFEYYTLNASIEIMVDGFSDAINFVSRTSNV